MVKLLPQRRATDISPLDYTQIISVINVLGALLMEIEIISWHLQANGDYGSCLEVIAEAHTWFYPISAE